MTEPSLPALTPAERLLPATVQSRRLTVGRVLLYVVLAAHVFFPLLWLVLVVQHGPLKNDWWHFRVVAEQFVSGQWAGLYSLDVNPSHTGYFWRYPPFALYVVAPLAWLSAEVAYGVLAGAGVLALSASLVRLSPMVAGPDRATWALAIILSAPVLTTIITGQLSGVLLLIVVTGAALWSQGRPVLACAVLGLLAIKPNLGVFFGLFAIVRGEWRGVIAMIAVIAGLVAATVPLGPQLWLDFLGASSHNSAVLGNYDAYKLITLQGFLAGLFGPSPLVSGVWAAAAVTLFLLAVWAWRSASTVNTGLAIVVLLGIAVNPYMSFYDAALWAYPATVWWTDRERWRPAAWKAVGVLIALAWIWEHVAHSWSPATALLGWPITLPFSLVGPVSAVWLVLAVGEVRAQTFAVQSRPQPCTG